MEHPFKGNSNRGGEFVEGFTIQQCRDLGVETVNAVEVRLSEERSDEVATQSLVTKTARARTFIQDMPPS